MVFSQPLRAAIDGAVKGIPSGRRGSLTLGASKAGAEVALGWRIRDGVTVGGYGVKAWRGGWDAGVRGVWLW